MNTIRKALDDCTPEQYEQVLHLWGMDGEPKQEKRYIRETLLHRMRNHIAAHFVWEYLTDDERVVLYRALSPSNRTGVQKEALQKKTQLSQEQYDGALKNLISYLLLQEEMVYMQAGQRMYASMAQGKKGKTFEQVVHVMGFYENYDALQAVGKELFTPKGDKSTRSLEDLLGIYNEDELYLVARSYAFVPQGFYTIPDLRIMIADTVLSLEEPLSYLPSLDESAKKLFLWLCERGSKASMQDVREYLRMDDAALTRMLSALAQCALVFETFSKNNRVLFIPQDLYSSLKSTRNGAESVPAKETFLPLETEPEAIRESETGTLFDIATVIGTVYQQNLEPTQAGRVPKRLANKIRPLLRGYPRPDYDGSDEYLEMVFEAVRNLGLIRLTDPPMEDMKPRYETDSQLTSWSQWDAVKQTRLILGYWLKNFAWRDLYGREYVSWNTYTWDTTGGRSALLKYLSTCIPGRWYTVESLLQKIWDEDAFAFRPTNQYAARPMSRRKTGDMRAKWNSCEGQVYTGILASTLYEMGIVDLGYEQQKDVPSSTSSTLVNPKTFRLTPFGYDVLATDKEPARRDEAAAMPDMPRALVVQPNFELLLLYPDLPTLYSVLPFAQINQIGVVSRLTLTKVSSLRGLEAGLSVERILHTLAERSQKELPQNVEYTIGDWTRQYKGVRISQVMLFEVSSEEAATQLCTQPQFQNFGFHQLTPCLIAIQGEVDLVELRHLLEKEGIFVRISGDIVTRPKYYSHSYYSGYR